MGNAFQFMLCRTYLRIYSEQASRIIMAKNIRAMDFQKCYLCSRHFIKSNNFYTKEKLSSDYLDAITTRIRNFLQNFIYDRILYKVLYINISSIEHLALKHTPFTTCNSLSAYLCAVIYLIHEITVRGGLIICRIHILSDAITLDNIDF